MLQWLSVRVPLDARERISRRPTSDYWDPAFPRLKFPEKNAGVTINCLGPKADVQFPNLWFSTVTIG